MSNPQDKTILVVDDEEDVRDYFADILRDAGFKVVTAADGDEALQRVREKIPDFISLDLVMPKKSGVKFLYELRHNKDWVNIPVVIVTAHAHDNLGKKELGDLFEDKSFRGPKFCLEKPINEEKYVQMVFENVGLEYDDSRSAATEEKQRGEVEELLKNADPETISEILKRLKKKG
jgi:CheY-like chemotaxis protein